MRLSANRSLPGLCALVLCLAGCAARMGQVRPGTWQSGEIAVRLVGAPHRADRAEWHDAKEVVVTYQPGDRFYTAYGYGSVVRDDTASNESYAECPHGLVIEVANNPNPGHPTVRILPGFTDPNRREVSIRFPRSQPNGLFIYRFSPAACPDNDDAVMPPAY